MSFHITALSSLFSKKTGFHSENSCTNAVQYTVKKTGFLSVKPVEGLLSKHATIMLVHISSLPCKIR